MNSCQYEEKVIADIEIGDTKITSASEMEEAFVTPHIVITLDGICTSKPKCNKFYHKM